MGTVRTDEQQMREQFEALRLPPDEWSQEVRDRLFKWDGRNYLNGKIDSEWHGFQDGYRARDSEVQALREENEQYYDLLLIVDLANDMPGWVNPNLSERIKAVLAGEEANDE